MTVTATVVTAATSSPRCAAVSRVGRRRTSAAPPTARAASGAGRCVTASTTAETGPTRTTSLSVSAGPN